MLLSIPQNHFWAGSACLAQDSASYSKDTIAVSDILTLIADLGNNIPDKSWMIYLFELFISRDYIPLELDLFCQFDGKNSFKAVFNGVNQHDFRTVPETEHSYQREIILDRNKHSIIFRLQDLNSEEAPEIFELGSENMNGSVSDQEKIGLITVIKEIKFEPYKHFTGIEWWNKTENEPYPIRYQVRSSMLRYAQSDKSSDDLTRLNYKPYRSLTPDVDSLGKKYPISFQNLTEMDRCICYDVNLGTTNHGMTYRI